MYKKIFFGILAIANIYSTFSTEKPHTVIAILDVKPDYADGVGKELAKIAELCRQESYCISYSVNKSKNTPNQFVLYEIWDSAADHQKQFDKQYIIDFIEYAQDKLSKPYQLITATEIPSVETKAVEKKLIKYFRDFLELDSDIKEVVKEKFKVSNKLLVEVLLDKISPAKIAAEIFMKHFSVDETQAIVDFHTSKAGIKFGDKFSDVIDEFQNALEEKMNNLQTNLAIVANKYNNKAN